MGLSQWLREHGPKTGSGYSLPPGVRTNGKKKVVFLSADGQEIKPVKKKGDKK